MVEILGTLVPAEDGADIDLDFEAVKVGATRKRGRIGPTPPSLSVTKDSGTKFRLGLQDMTTSLAEKYEQHLTPINKEGGKCWLVVSVVVSPHDAPRDQHGVPRMQFIGEPIPRKMERMVFQVDGFTTLDAEILEDGEHMRIICNQTHLPREVHRGFSEERAFQGSHFANGKVITWDE